MRYFCVSDIHSDCTDLRQALKRAGFNPKNKNHTLIVIGDVFDRMPETIEVYRFLSSIPKKRCILVRGNHELLFLDLLNKSYPESFDFSNGTVNTLCQIAGYAVADLHCGNVSWKEIVACVNSSKILAWLKSKQWVNYFELGPYIFAHSFIPVKLKERYKQDIWYYAPSELPGSAFEYLEDWRNAVDYAWEDATWGDPIDRYKAGLFDEESKKGKILVVGHWHVSDFWKRLANVENRQAPITDIYYSKDFIGLDCGMFRKPIGGYYHPQNVLVIDDSDFSVCYDQYGNKLKPI